MKALEENFTKFLKADQQFEIPIYQRKYSWTQSQCKQLWADIKRVSEDETIPAHFIGSIVYITPGLHHIGGVPKSLVIDGQQRLTTLSLLLLAMVQSLKKAEQTAGVTVQQIMNSYLVNEYCKDDKRIKLKLTRHDKEIFDKIVDGHDLNEAEKIERVNQNYQFFVNQIEKSGIDLDQLFHGIQKLIIVNIALDREDNPQLIFESLNSTGLDLSQSDLIRNYVLMGMVSDEQKDIYERYWSPMERTFMEGHNEEKFDYFMRGFLTIKMGAIPRLDAVYATFKNYIYGKEVEAVVSEIYEYSKYYARLDFNKESDQEIKSIISNIRTLKVEVAYPFLMQVYADYEHQKVTREEFIEILKMVEAYVFRRAICGIPTNSLNKTFANLYKEVDTEKYLESVKAIFILKDSYHRLPTDSEFQSEIVKKDVYNFRNNGYLFEKLEYYDNKERVNLEDLSIEHIMPQTLTPEWKEELGSEFKRVHAEYLNTLGNLTLTGYNSDMSNKPFLEKRDMEKGFRNGALRLSKGLRDLEEWNEVNIVERAKSLGELAVKIWQYSELNEETIELYRQKFNPEKESNYSLEDYEYIQGDILSLYELLSERIQDLGSDVKVDFMKLYIAFKMKTNFVDIVPQKSGLRLSLNMKYEEIDDPENKTVDVTGKGRWGNGDIEFKVSNFEDLDYAIFLIKQSFELQV